MRPMHAWSRWPSLCDGEVIFYDVDPAQPGHGGAPRQGRAHGVGGRQPRAADPQRAHAPVRCIDLDSASARRVMGGLTRHPLPGAGVQALLAAVAVAWALDIAPELMAAGMETFDPTAQAVR
jgi:cyanophycin synthetase